MQRATDGGGAQTQLITAATGPLSEHFRRGSKTVCSPCSSQFQRVNEKRKGLGEADAIPQCSHSIKVKTKKENNLFRCLQCDQAWIN